MRRRSLVIATWMVLSLVCLPAQAGPEDWGASGTNSDSGSKAHNAGNVTGKVGAMNWQDSNDSTSCTSVGEVGAKYYGQQYTNAMAPLAGHPNLAYHSFMRDPQAGSASNSTLTVHVSSNGRFSGSAKQWYPNTSWWWVTDSVIEDMVPVVGAYNHETDSWTEFEIGEEDAPYDGEETTDCNTAYVHIVSGNGMPGNPTASTQPQTWAHWHPSGGSSSGTYNATVDLDDTACAVSICYALVSISQADVDNAKDVFEEAILGFTFQTSMN